MNYDLRKNNFVYLKHFIPPETANYFYDELISNGKSNINYDDNPNEMGPVYNLQIPQNSQELLCFMTANLTNIVQEPLFPTYSFQRVYAKGSHLRKHTDRPACEISVTLHLGSDKPWAFGIEDPSGKEEVFNLNPGDAILYLGCVAKHWRDGLYQGDNYGQCFLHYVRSRGPCAYTMFDINKFMPDYDWENELRSQYYAN